MKLIEDVFDAVRGYVETYLDISTFSEERKEKIRKLMDSLEKKAKGV